MTYTNGYAIVEDEGAFSCKRHGKAMLKKVNGAFVPCSHVSIEDAKACMTKNGAKEERKLVVEDEDDDLFGSFEDEVDVRREGGKSEYLDSLDAKREASERENAKPVATFVLQEKREIGEIVRSGNLQYRVSEQPNYLSQREACEIEDLDPNVRAGWYTKVELVNER